MNVSVLNFARDFSRLRDHTVFLLYFGNLVDCTDLFPNAMPPSHSWNKLPSVRLDSVCWCLGMVLLSVFMVGIGL